jgi:hypothetical protein
MIRLEAYYLQLIVIFNTTIKPIAYKFIYTAFIIACDTYTYLRTALFNAIKRFTYFCLAYIQRKGLISDILGVYNSDRVITLHLFVYLLTHSNYTCDSLHNFLIKYDVTDPVISILSARDGKLYISSINLETQMDLNSKKKLLFGLIDFSNLHEEAREIYSNETK